MAEQEKRGSRTLVKCVVCGEIFDSSLDICPVCGVGREYFIPYEEEEVSFSKNTEEKFLILGNGAGGLNAAHAIRQRNKTCSIVIISEEPILSYNRPMLTKSLTHLTQAEILTHQKPWYGESDIINVLNSKISSMNVQEKYVELEDGKQVIYDKLVYALGAESFVPPIKGKEKQGVITIRKYEDVKKIAEMLPSIKTAAVIGGGVLGLEAALEISSAGVKVTVVEVADKLMMRQLDNEAGDVLGDIIKKAGIDIYVGAKIDEITGENGITGITLLDGTIIEAEMVVVSCGVKPNIEIAQKAGIQANRSIIVNEKMETNIEGVYACGDCAEFDGANYSIWPEAVDMGKVAGANAAGDDVVYKPAVPALTFHGMNTSLFAIGDNGKNESIQYKVKEIRDDATGQYEKYYFADNKLVGVILIGDTVKMNELTLAVEEGRTYEEVFAE